MKKRYSLSVLLFLFFISGCTLSWNSDPDLDGLEEKIDGPYLIWQGNSPNSWENENLVFSGDTIIYSPLPDDSLATKIIKVCGYDSAAINFQMLALGSNTPTDIFEIKCFSYEYDLWGWSARWRCENLIQISLTDSLVNISDVVYKSTWEVALKSYDSTKICFYVNPNDTIKLIKPSIEAFKFYYE